MITINFRAVEGNLVLIIVLLSLISLNCEKDHSVGNPIVKDDQVPLTNDIYEPNNIRSEAYEIGSFPFQQLEGVLIDEHDVDWYSFSITEKDTGEIKLTFKMEKMTDQLGIQGCFYDNTDIPKGCFKLYKGLDSDAQSSFGWKCNAGDYYFFVSVDTSSDKDVGQYCLDITK